MFGNFFGKLGIQQQTLLSNANSEPDKWRQQILGLGEYLGSVRLGSGSRKRIVESVRLVSEAAVWSDRRCPELLSVIIDSGLPKALLRLLREQQQRTTIKRETATVVTVQILQTLSIILDGVSDTRFLQALLGDGFVNELIGAPVDLECEEVLAYYVAFLKALSLKLTSSTIRYFFMNEAEGSAKFPLFTTAISLFDHPDSMVRVAVRAITLNVIRINDSEVLEFLLGAPVCAHFWGQVMHALKDCCDDAFRLLVDMPLDGSGAASWAAVDQVLENHMGLLAYVNDVCALGVDRINRRVALEFNERILTRTFIHAIDVGWRANATPEETLYMQVVTLCLAHFFAIVRYSPLLVDTVAALFTTQEEQQQQQTRAVDSEDDAGSAGSPHNYPRRLPHRAVLSPAMQSNHNPFIPSPFEPSRTLMPWLCVALEVLGNKAISPTVLVKSVLTPRRMLRTRALLESLTGGAALAPDDWRSDSAQSTLSSQTPHSLTGELTTAPPLLQLPPLTQTIVTAMVHILADSPPSHTWPTICLAANVLALLARSSRGLVILDSGLSDELVNAQRQHSAELRATLMAVDELAEPDDTGSEHSSSNSSSCSTSASAMTMVVSWKVLVKCLFDFANSSADTLRNKIQSESRHTFALHPTIKPPPLISALSPFDSSGGGAPQDAVLAAQLHQAHCLKRLVAASANGGVDSSHSVPAKGLYAADLHRWLGAHVNAASIAGGEDALLWRSATIIDNAAKHALPKKTMRLGFPASVACLDGVLVIRQATGTADDIVLVWPMADLAVARVHDEPSDAGHLPTLRLTDTPFPPLFFPALPQSMGGIPTSVTSLPLSPLKSRSVSPTKRLQYAYLGSQQRSLDISLRFRDAMECADVLGLLQRHVVVSRKGLASIYLKHNVI
ncbi:Protein CL16A [Coemansia sp. 'formosensis']|nr:Protein CL16A [Coemansia sp. 'formosensis']